MEIGIFRKNVTPQKFAEKAEKIGLHNVWINEGNQGKYAYEECWTDEKQSVAVHYLDDPISGMKYFCVRGSTSIAWLGDLAQRFDVWNDPQIIRAAMTAKTHDKQVDGIFRVAVNFTKSDPIIAKIFETFVKNGPNPIIRKAGLNATAYRRWDICYSLVEESAKSDPDKSVRDEAKRLLKLWHAKEGPVESINK